MTKPAAEPGSAQEPCEQVIARIAGIVAQGVKPDGDPEAAVQALAETLGVLEESGQVRAPEDQPLGERERAFLAGRKPSPRV